ncbi:MAG: ShlB/FhaC/HecB family hemolysin secretion/activation protein [Xenococcus sp. (in: cyanobacteria)]
MSQNYLLFRWKYHLLSAFLLTTGLIFIGQQKVVSAKSILHKSQDQELVTATIPLQKIPNKILSQQTLTQLPNPIPPRKIEPLEIPKQKPESEIPLELNPPEIPSLPETPKIPQTITVKKFEFIGNTAFSDEELAKTVAEFINRPISFAELLQIEEIIKNKYTAGCQGDTNEPCYINSGAFIPANQTFAKDGAIVQVQIVEGSIEQINITGLKRLNQSYVRSRIQKGISQPLERQELLDQLQILQLDPLIQNFSANLTAGSRPEKSILEINVIEADSFAIDLFTNNGRAPSVGTWRRGFRINEGNLLGIGDRIFGEYTNTDGSNKIDLGYFIPLNASNTTINIAGGINDTEVVEEPFDRLDIEGDSFNIEFGLRQPILRTPEQELALGITGSRQESKTKLLGENFPISSGADDNGETRISALRFYQEYTKRTLEDVFAIRSQLNIGLDVFDATVNDDQLPDSRFFAWRGQGQYVRRLAQDSLLVMRSDLQLAATNLVPLEQFSVGGLDSVRGYRQDAILTDNGFFASAEVRLPILRAQTVEGILQITPFFDFGVGWNSSDDADPEDQTFIGLGLGLQWIMGEQFSARLDYGIPLIDVEDSDETLQENGLYFSINYSPL